MGAADMALRFNEQPYNFNEGGNILAQFRGRGWAVLRDVFDRDSVDAFREVLLSRCEPPPADEVGARYVLPDDAPETVAPLYAPRLRQILPQTLSAPRTIGQPRASLVEASWIIEHEGSPESAPESPRRAWHKDQQHEGIGSGGYEYPLDVHLAIYLQDVESLECGPTVRPDPPLFCWLLLLLLAAAAAVTMMLVVVVLLLLLLLLPVQ